MPATKVLEKPMKMTEIKTKAKALGIDPKKMKRDVLSLQSFCQKQQGKKEIANPWSKKALFKNRQIIFIN